MDVWRDDSVSTGKKKPTKNEKRQNLCADQDRIWTFFLEDCHRSKCDTEVSAGEKINLKKKREALYWFQSLSSRQCLDAAGVDGLGGRLPQCSEHPPLAASSPPQ